MKKLLENTNLATDSKHYEELFCTRLKNEGLECTQPLRMKSLLAKFTGGRFLEVGCGIAPHCMEASKVANSEVWGLDFAKQLIRDLREKYPEINYIIGNAIDLPFKDNFFDYLIAGEVIEHMEEPSTFLKELKRVIKPNGIIALSTPLDDNGNRSPLEHIWSFGENDIKTLLTEKFRGVETSILLEPNPYIIGYGTK